MDATTHAAQVLAAQQSADIQCRIAIAIGHADRSGADGRPARPRHTRRTRGGTTLRAAI